ncbi:MAG: S-methyl-5-thioribose-1-phosphate isomerase, partial [Solirubrobacteraceae bacterium]
MPPVKADRRRPPGRPIVALRWEDGILHALDQTGLPWREDVLELRSAAEVASAIRRLSIRGAPLIGVAAGYGVALETLTDRNRAALEAACALLRGARPTAVNLAVAVDRVREAAIRAPAGAAGAAALAEASALHAEEERASATLADHGA